MVSHVVKLAIEEGEEFPTCISVWKPKDYWEEEFYAAIDDFNEKHGDDSVVVETWHMLTFKDEAMKYAFLVEVMSKFPAYRIKNLY